MRRAAPRGPGSHPPVLKRLGQHFLNDESVLAAIADSLELTGEETVVEIGPGRGALTRHLAGRSRRLVLIELDRALAANLREEFAKDASVEVVEADVLDANIAELAGGPYVLVGNVPYYITTPIIFHALKPPMPLRAVFLVQKEVAERMAADADDEEYGALSVTIQALTEPELLLHVPPSAFTPAPKVHSAVVRLRPRITPLVPPETAAGFQAFVQSFFGMRRKQLGTIVRALEGVDTDRAREILTAGGWDPSARPETLSPPEFARLYATLRGGS
ncbi:MAG TPA: 16S rRNA (adenine(1518)-N(6)/adenine(1519)-N(6))-dimethyltransferase RsmA [Gemmatimonadaceae bacterium]|nr:16S rRNA (adenine(1518)-N(6)/adenine(1519)-N(6))-dimethyltransferase RsmA [Gemmatimonadaceae bacterium]